MNSKKDQDTYMSMIIKNINMTSNFRNTSSEERRFNEIENAFSSDTKLLGLNILINLENI